MDAITSDSTIRRGQDLVLSHLISPTLQTRILMSQDLGQGIHFFSFLTGFFRLIASPFLESKSGSFPAFQFQSGKHN
jgi:hypothetical protein